MTSRLLDAFCGAGGCTAGYQRAGFYVVGIDIAAQPNYCGDEFIQADALELLADFEFLAGFDAIHASPPCQHASTIAKQVRKTGNLGRVDPAQYDDVHPNLIPRTRELLIASGLPYVVENVIGAELVNPIQLCGSSFGLDVRRHRLFECSFPVLATPCAHHWQLPRFRSLDQRRGLKSVIPVHGSSQLASVVGVHGHINYAGEMELRKKAMDVDWMNPYELTQAIPPAYCEWIGEFLMAEINARQAA